MYSKLECMLRLQLFLTTHGGLHGAALLGVPCKALHHCSKLKRVRPKLVNLDSCFIVGAAAGSSYNLTQGAQDIIKLSGLDFTTAFPSHDHATGVPKAAVVEFAQDLQSAA